MISFNQQVETVLSWPVKKFLSNSNKEKVIPPKYNLYCLPLNRNEVQFTL